MRVENNSISFYIRVKYNAYFYFKSLKAFITMHVESQDVVIPASEMHLNLETITRDDHVEATPTAKTRKLKPRALTIEDVFESVSKARSCGLNPPPERIVLTPRSAEACLRSGVNPETLKLRDFDSFYDAEVTAAVQRMRHEAYALRRHEEMQVVRSEKQKVVAAEAESVYLSKVKGNKASSSIASSRKGSFALVDIERRRLEKVRQRQERELEQMLEFEMKMNRLQQEATEKVERERRQHEAMERSKVRLAQEVAANKRARELQKKAQLDIEEARRKELTLQLAARDRALAEEKAQQDKVRRLEAKEREEERKLKAEEHRAQTEKLLRAQQLEVQKRLHELEVAEKAREETVEKQRAERAIGMEVRRREVMQRIQKNLKASKRLEAQRQREMQKKQEASDVARKEHEEEERRIRALQLQQQAEVERKRLLVLEETRREEARKKQEILERQQEMDRNLQQVQQQQQEQRRLRCEYRKVQAQLKMDKVERMKRVQEYQRLEMMRKLHDTEARTQQMLNEKESLVTRRKHLAMQTKIQRDLILQTMEKVKITKKWHQASKTIGQVLTYGKRRVGDAKVDSPATSFSAERPKSSSNVVGRQTFLPNLSQPTTPKATNHATSEAHQLDGFLPLSPAPSQTSFKFLKEVQNLQNSAARTGATAQPYLSPYASLSNTSKGG